VAGDKARILDSAFPVSAVGLHFAVEGGLHGQAVVAVAFPAHAGMNCKRAIVSAVFGSHGVPSGEIDVANRCLVLRAIILPTSAISGFSVAPEVASRDR